MDKKKNINLPYWYQLLNFWVNQENNSGLTIPFLIGAKYEYITERQTDKNSIHALFEEVLEAQTLPYCPGLTYCNTLEAYILTLVPTSEIESPFFMGLNKKPSLVLLDGIFGKEITLEWIIDFLELEYSEPIRNSTYSRERTNFGGWQNFDAKDITQIKQSLNII